MCGCNEPLTCGCSNTGCKEKDISTDCVLYTGDNLSCSGILKGTILTDVIKQLDAYICTRFSQMNNFITLKNIGDGAEIYKGDNNQGAKLIKSLVSLSDNLTITEEDETITFEYDDIFVQSGTLNSGTGILTFTRSDATTFNVDLSALVTDLYTVSGSLNTTSGVATFNRNNASTYTLDLSSLRQVKTDYLESNSTSVKYIDNAVPVKTINNTTQYTVQASDNKYVIEVANGANNIDIIIPNTLPGDNFFVGFIQKGTGTVTFQGFDIKPVDLAPVIYGQGHNAAIEIIGGNIYVFGSLKQE